MDQRKLKILLWVIMLSIGFYGVKGGLWSLLTGTQWMVLGPPESFLSGNTEIGMALNMILPFFLFLRREPKRAILRHFLLCGFFLTIIGILGTYSRGAFLGLVVVLFVLTMKSKFKLLALILLVLGIPLVIANLPEKWSERMHTIRTYEEDASANERLRAWRVARKIAFENPFLGGGFRVYSPEIYEKHDPEGPEQRTDAHSIYFQMLAENGFTGLAIFLGLALSLMGSLRGIIREERMRQRQTWISNYAHMLEASLWSYFVCGAFLSMAYFDLYYHLATIVIILKQLSKSEEALPANSEAKS